MTASPDNVFRCGSATVRIYPRRDGGGWSITWREAGRGRSTTRRTREAAAQHARQLARALDQRTGALWVPPASAAHLEMLRGIAGPGANLAALLADLDAARRLLAGAASLEAAARHYMSEGPGSVSRVPVAAAVERFLDEYAASPSVTVRPLRSLLGRFVAAHPGLLVSDLCPELLQTSIQAGRPGPRTIHNRLAYWKTFLNRCRDWGYLPPHRKHAAEQIRRPRRPDAGREILTVDEARALLAVTRRAAPRLLPFLLLGGWLGLRSSELQRLEWRHFDWPGRTLHVPPEVARKLLQERYLPVPDPVAAALAPLAAAATRPRCCLWRSQEYLSRLARDSGVLSRWPGNVLRHSWFSYTLAAHGHIERLAEWGGNSAAVIRSNYRRPIPAAAGEAYLLLPAGLQP